MKKTKKIVAALCAVVMLVSVLAMPPVEQVYADTRQELQEQLRGLPERGY